MVKVVEVVAVVVVVRRRPREGAGGEFSKVKRNFLEFSTIKDFHHHFFLTLYIASEFGWPGLFGFQQIFCTGACHTPSA